MPNLVKFSLIFISIYFTNCSNDKFSREATNQIPKINFLNLAKTMRELDSANYTPFDKKAPSIYGESYAYFLGYCLKIGTPGDTFNSQGLNQFYTDKYVKRLEKHLATNFDKDDKTQKELLNYFQRLSFFLPEGKVPKRIVYINSLYTSSVCAVGEDLAIGIERYLGKEVDVIKELPEEQFFPWIKAKMERKYLSRDALIAWIRDKVVEPKTETLAEAMIQWGKILFIADVCINKEKSDLTLRYSLKELAWAKENETPLWKYLIKESILFSKNDRDQTNLLNDAPFTIGLPKKGPDRLGQFIGLQIVEAFMSENECDLQTLINTPYTKILQAYKPN